MPQYLELPDGSYLELKEGQTAREGMAVARVKFPDLFPQEPEAPKPAKKAGISGALGLGLESLISSGKTALGALTEPEQAGQEALLRQQKLQEKYEEPASWERVKQAYEQKGLLPAAGEALSQIPKAIAEQAPQMGATLGGARLGATAGSVFGPVGSVVGGVAGAAIPSLVQQFGGNVQRQAAEGQPIDRTAAAAAAVPQAALDVASTLIPLGGKFVSQLTGIPEKALLIGNRNAQKLAEERLAATLAKGTAVGAAAEIPTEIAQQMLERAQAGLSLTSPDALAEYGQTAYQVGLLAPIGAAGRVSERAGARKEVADEAKAKAAADRLAAQQAEQQRISDEQARYAKLETEVGGGTTAAQLPYYESRQQSLPGMEMVEQPETPEEPFTRAPVANRKELQQQIAALEQQKQEAVGAAPEFIKDLDDKIKEAQAQLTPASVAGPTNYREQARNLNAQMVDLQTKAQTTTSLDEKIVLARQYQQLQKAAKEAETEARKQAAPENTAVGNLLKKMKDAETNGDLPAQARIAEQLKALGVESTKQAPSAQMEMPLFKHTPISESRASFGARVYKPGAPMIEAQEEEALAEAERQRQQAAEEADRARRIAPEQIALRRIAEKPAYSSSVGEGQISGAVERLVDAVVKTDSTPTGKVVSGAGDSRVSRGDSLRAQFAYAQATNNKERAIELRDQLKALNEPETEQAAGDLELGEAAKQAGVEGRQGAGTMQANRTTRLAQSQLTSFDRLADFIQTVRESDQNIAETRKKTLRDAAERLKDITAGLALNEMDARRAQAGMAALTTEEKTRAAGRMNAILNELITRGAGLFAKPAAAATTRGAATIQGAEESRQRQRTTRFNTPFDDKFFAAKDALITAQTEGRRAAQQAEARLNAAREAAAQPNAKPGLLEEALTYDPVVKAGQEAERRVARAQEEFRQISAQRQKSLDEQANAPIRAEAPGLFSNLGMAATSLRGQLRQVMDETVGVKAAPPRKPVVPRKAEEGLRIQFTGQERGVQQRFEAAKARADEAQRTTLQELEDKFKNLSAEAQDMALEQARSIELGRGIDIPTQLQEELADLRRAGESETGQAELFPGESEKGVTRTTSNRFIRYLDSGEVEKMRLALAEQARMAEFQAKRAATIQRKMDAEIQQQQNIISKLTAPWFESPVKAARKAFEKAVDKNKAASDLAAQINKKRVVQRQAAGEKVATLLTAVNEAKKHLKEIQEVHDILAKRYLTTPMVASRKQGFEAVTQQLEAAEKSVAAAQKSLEKGQAAQTRLLERQAADTINNAILREGQKAEGAIERARLAVVKAQAEEDAAAARLRRLKQMPTAKPQEETAAETVARLPVTGVTRVYRDTSDPVVQANVADQRKLIGKWENAYENAYAAGDERALEIAVRNIENAYNRVYEILNNAPLKQETQLSEKELRDQKDYEQKQYGTVQALTKLFEEKTGAKLKLSERKVEGVVRVKSGRPVTAIKEPSLAQQEAQFKAEEESGEYAAKTLEDLAKVRAKLREVTDRIAYIDANKAEPRTPARMKQNVARSQAVAERTRLEGEERRLSAMQKAVEREAKAEKRAVKAVRTEKTRMVREAGRLQEAIDIDEGLAAPIREEAGTPISPETYRQLLDGSIVRAVNDIADNSEVPLLKETASKVKDFILRTKFSFVPEIVHKGKKVAALYDPASNTVYMTPEGRTQEDLIHEVTHAATMRALTMPDADLTAAQRAAKKELQDMYDAMQKDARFKDQYALEDLKEFVSEVQSNQGLRDLMDKKPGLLQRFFNAVLRLFGVSPTVLNSAQAQAAIEKLYLQSRVIEEAAPVASGSTAVMDDLISKTIQQPKTFREKIGTNPALEAEMQGVDMRAGLRETLKHGDDKLFKQAMYNVLKADQKLPMAYAVLNNGPLETYKDDKGFYGVRSTGKDSGKDVFEAISEIPLANARDKVNAATMYMVAQRALNKGIHTLDFGALGIKEEDLRALMAEVDANPRMKAALENVRAKYNKYNEGLINFAVQANRIPKKKARELLATGDYVPFYRVRDNGTAELVYGDDLVLSVGDIRYQPYLKELKGGENKILPLDESLYRNTLLLTDAALSNMATKSVAYGLQAIGKGAGNIDPKTGQRKDKMAIHSGNGPDDANVIRFYSEPDPNKEDDDGRRWQKIDTEDTVAEGVPAALVVKSMEGAHLPLPSFLKAAGAFSDVLRSGVTRMPPYILRQLIRDPMAASFTGGLNYGPIRAMVKAGKEFVGQYRGTSTTAAKLIEKGLMQSGIFTGDADDMSKIALQIASGKDQSAMEKVFAALDQAALRADASTRALVYENALKNGLSEVEADMMTMESMNFYKRGLNPAVQYANRLIPFINSQIQGLNVLYKAATGKMPFEEQQKIKQKFFNNAVFLMGLGVVYAMAMDDDEFYKNARPRDKYTNFFLHLPGVEEPIKIPTPFEAGYFFSVSVALVDALKSDNYTPEQWQAVRDMFLNSIPGWSSRGVPQIVKPAFEVFTNKNFMSGAPIESMRQQNLDITERYNANTTEFAKQLSKALPILSPVQIEHLTRGYLGVAPLVAFSAANQLFAPATKGEAPAARASDLPFFGSMFQKKYGGADADSMYRMAKEAEEARTTFNRMRKEGRQEEAKEYFADHRAEIASAPAAGQYRQLIGRLNLDMERARNRQDMTAEQKRKRLDDLEKAKQDAADRFMQRFYQIESRF